MKENTFPLNVNSFYKLPDGYETIFKRIFTFQERTNIIISCQNKVFTEEFYIFRRGRDSYFIHMDSGIIIKWNENESFTCNIFIDVNDFEKLILILKAELIEDRLL